MKDCRGIGLPATHERSLNKMNETTSTSLPSKPFENRNSLSFITTNFCLVLTIIFAIFGNVLVCAACIISKRLQSFVSAFIISLAVSDILIGSVSMPVWLSVQLTGNPDRVSFPNIYTAWLCFDITCGTASIMNLVLISIDRFLAVNHPLRYPIIVTQTRVALGVSFIWVYSIVIAALYLINWSEYVLFVSAMSFFVPLFIMILAYSQIFHVALTHVRNIRRINTDQSITNRGSVERFSRDLKASRTLSIVIGAFVICWCPFFVVGLLAVYCRSCQMFPKVSAMTKWLHYGNSAINPIIYSCLNRHFRLAFKVTLLRGYQKISRCS